MADEEASTVVNTSAEPAPAAPEATPEEPTEAAADQPTESPDPKETSQQETEAGEPEDSSDQPTAEETTTEQPKKGAEARKEQLNQEIRDLVAKRNEIRKEVETANAEFYKPASVDELMVQENPDTGEYYSRLEAQLEALRQEREVEKYNNQIAESRLTLQTEAARALEDFPMFDQASPDYNPDVAAEVDAILQGVLDKDPNTGQVVGSKVSVYQLYKSYATAARAFERKAELAAQRSAEKQLTNADPTPGGQGKVKGFNEMSLAEQEAYLRRKGHDV